MLKKRIYRVMFSLIGVLFIGLSVGLSRLASLGTDPFTTLNTGLSNIFSMQYGTMLLVSNLVGIVFVVLFARHLIGVGTIFNIVLVGYISDFIIYLAETYFTVPTNFFVQFIVMAFGMVMLAMGAGLYIVADQGVAPYDALPVIIEDRTRVSFRAARVTSDIICIVLGFSLGATVGIATIIAGFLMGPLIQFFRTYFGRKIENLEEKITA